MDSTFFVIASSIVAASTSIFFYKKYSDLLAPHVLIPVIYFAIIISAVNLDDAIDQEFVLEKIYWAVFLGIVFFSAGGFFSIFVIKEHNLHTNSIDINLKALKFFSFTIWFIPISALLYTFVAAGVPLLSPDPEMTRFYYLREVGGYINNLFTLLIPGTMMIMISYILKLFSKKHAYLFIGLGIVFFILLGYRSRVLYVIISVGIISYYYYFAIIRAKINFSNILLKGGGAVGMFFILFALIGYYRLSLSGELSNIAQDNASTGDLFVYFITSYLRSLTYVMGKTIELAEYTDFLYGSSYIDTILSPLPGFSPQLLDEYLKEQLFPGGFSGGGSPPTIIGEAYINFGLTGVSINLFICGFVLAFLHRQLILYRHISTLIIYSYLYQFFLISGFFSGLLLFFQYVLSLLVMLSGVFICKILLKKARHQSL